MLCLGLKVKGHRSGCGTRKGLKVLDVVLSFEGEESLKWVWYKEWAEGV